MEFKTYEPVDWPEGTVSSFTPQKYHSFKVKIHETVNAFMAVNNLVEKIADDIDTICSNLNTLKAKFNEYNGLDDNIRNVQNALKQFRTNIIVYNKKLNDAANQCCESIKDNYDKFDNQVLTIQEGLARISVFGGTTNVNK